MRETARGSRFSEERSVMDRQHILKLGRAYAFLARNLLGGKIINVLLDLLAFMVGSGQLEIRLPATP